MHRKITVKALTLVFFLFSIAIFANDDRKTIYAFNEMKREEGCKKGEWI